MVLSPIAHEPVNHSTPYLISGPVHTMVHITLPTADAYGTFIISDFFAFVFGLYFLDNLQFVGSVDPIGFTSDMEPLKHLFHVLPL